MFLAGIQGEVLTGPPTHSTWLRVVVSISRTTIKTFGGDNSEKIITHEFLMPAACCGVVYFLQLCLEVQLRN